MEREDAAADFFTARLYLDATRARAERPRMERAKAGGWKLRRKIRRNQSAESGSVIRVPGSRSNGKFAKMARAEGSLD